MLVTNSIDYCLQRWTPPKSDARHVEKGSPFVSGSRGKTVRGVVATGLQRKTLLSRVGAPGICRNSKFVVVSASGLPSESLATSGRDLYVGLSGSDVHQLQGMLCRAGHLDTTLQNGSFCPKTHDAVCAWQLQHDLPATGFWGPMSRKVGSRELLLMDDPLASVSGHQRPIVPWKSDPKTHTNFVTTFSAPGPPRTPAKQPQTLFAGAVGVIGLGLVTKALFKAGVIGKARKGRSHRMTRRKRTPSPAPTGSRTVASTNLSEWQAATTQGQGRFIRPARSPGQAMEASGSASSRQPIVRNNIRPASFLERTSDNVNRRERNGRPSPQGVPSSRVVNTLQSSPLTQLNPVGRTLEAHDSTFLRREMLKKELKEAKAALVIEEERRNREVTELKKVLEDSGRYSGALEDKVQELQVTVAGMPAMVEDMEELRSKLSALEINLAPVGKDPGANTRSGPPSQVEVDLIAKVADLERQVSSSTADVQEGDLRVQGQLQAMREALEKRLEAAVQPLETSRTQLTARLHQLETSSGEMASLERVVQDMLDKQSQQQDSRSPAGEEFPWQQDLRAVQAQVQTMWTQTPWRDDLVAIQSQLQELQMKSPSREDLAAVQQQLREVQAHAPWQNSLVSVQAKLRELEARTPWRDDLAAVQDEMREMKAATPWAVDLSAVQVKLQDMQAAIGGLPKQAASTMELLHALEDGLRGVDECAQSQAQALNMKLEVVEQAVHSIPQVWEEVRAVERDMSRLSGDMAALMRHRTSPDESELLSRVGAAMQNVLPPDASSEGGDGNQGDSAASAASKLEMHQIQEELRAELRGLSVEVQDLKSLAESSMVPDAPEQAALSDRMESVEQTLRQQHLLEDELAEAREKLASLETAVDALRSAPQESLEPRFQEVEQAIGQLQAHSQEDFSQRMGRVEGALVDLQFADPREDLSPRVAELERALALLGAMDMDADLVARVAEIERALSQLPVDGQSGLEPRVAEMEQALAQLHGADPLREILPRLGAVERTLVEMREADPTTATAARLEAVEKAVTQVMLADPISQLLPRLFDMEMEIKQARGELDQGLRGRLEGLEAEVRAARERPGTDTGLAARLEGIELAIQERTLGRGSEAELYRRIDELEEWQKNLGAAGGRVGERLEALEGWQVRQEQAQQTRDDEMARYVRSLEVWQGEMKAESDANTAQLQEQIRALEEAFRQSQAQAFDELSERLFTLERTVETANREIKDLERLGDKVAALEAALAAPPATKPKFQPEFQPPPPPDPQPEPEPEPEPELQPRPQMPRREGGHLWRLEEGREVLLQGFHWDSCKHDWYSIVSRSLDSVQDAGFTGVWLPPPSDSLAPQGYLPRDLYNLNTKYGSQEQLKDLLSQMHDSNLHVIADIVINHRCATTQGANGDWNRWDGVRMDWGEWAVSSGSFSGQGQPATGDDFHAAPNIDHTNERVQNDICEWLQWLRNDIGFDSLRFDFSKGYGGKFAKRYIEAAQPEFSVGEYWDTCRYNHSGLDYNQDEHRQQTVNWIDQSGGQSAAFDFTTKGILQEAAGNSEWWRLKDPQGKPPGVIGVWPSHAVTFVDNHDTGSSQAHWPFPGEHVMLGYAYILTHPGTPCVAWDHFFDWGEDIQNQIKTLVQLRKSSRISSRSKVHIEDATADQYAAIIDDRVAMKVGRGSWKPSGNWEVAACGKDYCVWTKK
ncbi:alpha-amylase [Cymbomonas tetramitiformis]|uniref:alpha-amylase n=1 Tax=Cymbomonas tetramitiformis TaxID=36881 RepID=A0AAE0GEI1_9CHLO|nr:alpha-amylase [Cymbomonas tetramitiformis]